MKTFPSSNVTLDELQTFYNNRLVVVNNNSIPDDVYEWCDDHSIEADYIGRYTDKHIWYVIKDDDRVMFSLRWQ